LSTIGGEGGEDVGEAVEGAAFSVAAGGLEEPGGDAAVEGPFADAGGEDGGLRVD
jgi:hypothetical protein